MKKLSLFLASVVLSANAFGSTNSDIVKKFKDDHKDFAKYQYAYETDRLSMCYKFMAMNDTYKKLTEDQKSLAINSSNKKKVNRSFSIGKRQCKYWIQ